MSFPEQELFIRVVELGSIRAAAQEAGVEPSSVSRRMTNLENRLGAKLLERAGAASRVTEAGQQYYQQMREILGQITALEDSVAGQADAPRGRLRVNATIDFGQNFVAGWLLDFKQLYPDVDVELSLSSRNIDLIASGTDVALRVGEQPDSSLVARKIALVPRVIAAAPSYLARRGVPQHPRDLADHDHIFFHPENRHQPLSLRGPDGKPHEVQRKGGITINAISGVVEAARRGHGIHAGPAWACQPAFEDGSLVALLPDYRLPVPPMYAVRAPATFVPARIRAFVDFVAAEVIKVPGLLRP